MNKLAVAAGIFILAVVLAVASYAYTTTYSGIATTGDSSGSRIQVVAAENFWGSLVGQIGGAQVNVTSIVSNPNSDPHEYESNTANARAIADAGLVVVNGANYDTWARRLINASVSPNRLVLIVQNAVGLAGRSDLNPHFWYDPYYVNKTTNAMYRALVTIEPGNKAYFQKNYAALNASLYQSFMGREQQIKRQFLGTPVAATEDIFAYMANATGLRVVSPPGFMQAVAEGNDPSPQDIVAFQNLMQGGNTTVRVLVYNEQTLTPVTQNIKSLAAQHQIPTTGVTETIQPPDVTFQAWMGAELISLQNALNAQALGQ